MITHTKLGGRTVELFVPFKSKGKKVTKIVFGPPTLGHTFAWQAGEYTDALELMAELAGIDTATIRAIPYPDADRVMAIFLEMLPAEIRETIGRVSSDQPQQQPEVKEQVNENEPVVPPAAQFDVHPNQISPNGREGSPHPYVMGEATGPVPGNPLGLDLDVSH